VTRRHLLCAHVYDVRRQKDAFSNPAITRLDSTCSRITQRIRQWVSNTPWSIIETQPVLPILSQFIYI